MQCQPLDKNAMHVINDALLLQVQMNWPLAGWQQTWCSVGHSWDPS